MKSAAIALVLVVASMSIAYWLIDIAETYMKDWEDD